MKRTTALITVLGAAALAVSPAASAATKYNWLKYNSSTHQPLVMAHQGGEDEFPSNTMFAFKSATKAGATALELDIGVTADGKIIVMHDTTVNRVTNGTGNVSSLTLAQIKKLDGAYWFSKTGQNGGHYSHNLATSAYTWRGVATGAKSPPKGFKRSDFQIATLDEVMKAFPKTPINIEIKGRTPTEATSEYTYNATVLANYLKSSSRTDVVVVSFTQDAVDTFSSIAKKIPTAPGIAGDLAFFWTANPTAAPNTVAFQVPNQFSIGGQVIHEIANCGYINMAHSRGYAWHQWFGTGDVDGIGTGVKGPDGHFDGGWKYLLDRRVDGIMTASPVALVKYMKTYTWGKSSNFCKFKGGGGY
jgi:glycerophosphoryl diester phosphodiesterase